MAELDADLVLPAHGDPFRGISRRVRELLAHHDEREAEVLEAVSHGERTGYQVASALPWTRRRRTFFDLQLGQQRMALTETLAQFQIESGIRARFVSVGAVAVPPSLGRELLLLVHAALSNVRRHSAATCVDVALERDGRKA